MAQLVSLSHTDTPHATQRSLRSAAITRVVLLVVAEPNLRELLSLALRAAGCYPLAMASVADADRVVAHLVPDLLLVDLDALLPEEAHWPGALVQRHADKPVKLVLLMPAVQASTWAERPQAVQADLQVTKPVDARKLNAQLLRLLRGHDRARSPAADLAERLDPHPGLHDDDGERDVLRLRGIELDRVHPTVRLRAGAGWLTVDLPITEHRLLEFLLTEPGRVRSREEIRHAVWQGAPVDLRTVDQYVRRLRRSLLPAAASELVMTVNRSGYRAQIDRLASPGAANGSSGSSGSNASSAASASSAAGTASAAGTEHPATTGPNVTAR